jgi:hypothetical protein
MSLSTRHTFKWRYDMQLIQGVVDGFIMAVDITPPKPFSSYMENFSVAEDLI